MTESRIPINEADEEDIQEMVDLVADVTARGAATCPYRERLYWHFGGRGRCSCPNREKLKEDFERWVVCEKPAQRAREEKLKK